MQGIRDFIVQKAKEIQKSEDLYSERRANSLIGHQKEIDLCSKEIKEKYSLLEEHMKQQLKQSLGL